MASVIDYVSLKPGDFLTDTAFQTWDAALCGAYCRIIFYLYKNNGRTPEDIEELGRLSNWRGDFTEAWKKLRTKFRVKNGCVYHKRVSKELRRARRAMQAKSSAGRKGAEARWQTYGTGNADAMPSKEKVSKEKHNPPTPQGGFDKWWKAYPQKRRQGKPQCQAKWKALSLEARADEIIAALERWKTSERWTKDDGQFICGPHKWLNQHYYDEDPPQIPTIVPLSVTPEQRKLAEQRFAQQVAGVKNQYAQFGADAAVQWAIANGVIAPYKEN